MKKILILCGILSVSFFGSCKREKNYDEHDSPLMQVMHAMFSEMEMMQMTNDPDHDFATMMKEHHQGAIKMADYELSNGDDPKIKNMAQMMKDMQAEEIKVLDSFLNAHTPTGNNMNFMTVANQAMDKMDKEADAQSLNGDSDHDFAHLMIPHHQSATEMAQAELQYGQVPMLKEMAQKMIDDQQKEINDLRNWLNTND